jgi:uncharacterized protein (UPF0179 family)
MKVAGIQSLEIEVSERELSYALMEKVLQLIGARIDFDDAGCDWITRGDFTYIGDENWKVSDNYKVARLVDAANVLRIGETLHL